MSRGHFEVWPWLRNTNFIPSISMKFATMHFSTKRSYTMRHSQYQSRWIWKLKMSSFIPRRGDDIFLRIPTIFLKLHLGSALSVMATDLYLHDLRYQHDFLSTKNALVWWNDAITEFWWAFPEGIVQTKNLQTIKEIWSKFLLKMMKLQRQISPESNNDL